MLLRLHDVDTGESTLDVVKCPEGVALQLKHELDPIFRSIILDASGAAALARVLLPCPSELATLREFLEDPEACPGHPIPGRRHSYSSGPHCVWCGTARNNDHDADGA